MLEQLPSPNMSGPILVIDDEPYILRSLSYLLQREGYTVETAVHGAEGLHFFWNGPDDLPRNLKLEWRFVAVRWLGIACLAPSLPLAHLPFDRLAAAYLVLIVATVYNAGLQHLMPRRPQWLANGYISTLGDALLDIAMVIVGGGFDSPFYFILFTVTLAAPIRYGYGPSLGVALL